MSKQLRNPTARVDVKVHYEDVNGLLYKVDTSVVINSSYEIDSIDLKSFEAFDANDEKITPVLTKNIIEQIETMAGSLALERIQPEDFAKEKEIE